MGWVGRVRCVRAVRHGGGGERRNVSYPFWRDLYQRDQRFRAELDYTAERGIAHSVFLTWSEDDQDKVLAWQAIQRAKCPGCGLPVHDTTQDEMAWDAEALRCFACKAKAVEAKRYKDNADGLLVWATRE